MPRSILSRPSSIYGTVATIAGTTTDGTALVGTCATTGRGSMAVGGAVHSAGITGDGTVGSVGVHIVPGPHSVAVLPSGVAPNSEALLHSAVALAFQVVTWVVGSRGWWRWPWGTSLNRRTSVTSFANRKRRPPQAPPVGLLSCRWFRSAAGLYEDQQSVRAKKPSQGPLKPRVLKLGGLAGRPWITRWQRTPSTCDKREL